MYTLNTGLATAFPAELWKHTLASLEAFPEPELPPSRNFSVRLGSQSVDIPYRIYNSPLLIAPDRLTDLEMNLADCLLTRHHNGFVRQPHLGRIIHLRHSWVPPFVVQLLGEYVIEIIELINDNLSAIDDPLYRNFIIENRDFLAQTSQRVSSYRDRYYPDRRREDYVGFKVLRYFKSLAA
jgi:hypothetical protein